MITVIADEVPITWHQWDRMMHNGWSCDAALHVARGSLVLMRRSGRELLALVVD